ncbi:peptidoglycan-recognition protein SB2-like isoform X3 [Anopheles bellator]|uniref:peptidoglycan-recognition protein SB2-like isoform X3 n=1 Tax=Anopheles bellator TaxID=139047 RepID=UPI0026485536|nr:peptidoglycan-recognition protein SB2-like isoform X3 [Anopheles bellator]
MLVVLNSRLFASIIERRLVRLPYAYEGDDQWSGSRWAIDSLLECAGAKCFTFMLATARSVAASGSSRLNRDSPINWLRKVDGSWEEDLEGGARQNERTPLLLAAGGRGVRSGGQLVDRPWPVSHPFFLVDRAAWWHHPVELHAPALDRTAITDVIVLHTHTIGCFTQEDCLRFLQRTEDNCWATGKEHIPFNFLIGGDGVTYEARGWKSQHGFTDLPGHNTTLVVGLIGDFTERQPPEVQYAELKALFTESIRRFSLSAHYRIHGVTRGAQSAGDATALYSQLQRWPHWAGLVAV